MYEVQVLEVPKYRPRVHHNLDSFIENTVLPLMLRLLVQCEEER